MALRSHTKTARAEPRGTAPLNLVDTALSLAVRREVFTAEEAMELLHGVQNKVHDCPAEDVLARIVWLAEDSYRDTPLVDRSQVVDPLLDMRLALTI
jgi:hypothetical protein